MRNGLGVGRCHSFRSQSRGVSPVTPSSYNDALSQQPKATVPKHQVSRGEETRRLCWLAFTVRCDRPTRPPRSAYTFPITTRYNTLATIPARLNDDRSTGPRSTALQPVRGPFQFRIRTMQPPRSKSVREPMRECMCTGLTFISGEWPSTTVRPKTKEISFDTYKAPKERIQMKFAARHTWRFSHGHIRA